jgi:hypothetical protein
MKIKILSKKQFRSLYSNKEKFIISLNNTIYIIRDFISESLIDDILVLCKTMAINTLPNWHPCVDNSPDYHRLHNNYKKAYVKTKQHSFYFHPWNENRKIFRSFKSIFDLKLFLMNKSISFSNYMNKIPSDNSILRLVVHKYPPGGYQEEHVDPVSSFAKVQTIIQASTPSYDYESGGLYVNHDRLGIINIDALTKKGDLILMSPGIKHGVAKINQKEKVDFKSVKGRWIIMPIIIASDMNKSASKPRGLNKYQ